jgi:hypothetical protein
MGMGFTVVVKVDELGLPSVYICPAITMATMTHTLYGHTNESVRTLNYNGHVKPKNDSFLSDCFRNTAKHNGSF